MDLLDLDQISTRLYFFVWLRMTSLSSGDAQHQAVN